MEENNIKSPERDLKRITVYVSPRLKRDIEAYKEKHHYSSLSGMFKIAYRILKQVMTSGPITPKKISLKEDLENIPFEETVTKLLEWKKEKNFSPEELKSIINQIKDPIVKLVAQKILLKGS